MLLPMTDDYPGTYEAEGQECTSVNDEQYSSTLLAQSAGYDIFVVDC